MKILLVHDIKPESLNGVSVSVATLAYQFKAMGHDVRFLTLNESVRTGKADDQAYRIGSLPTGIYPGARISMNIWSRGIKKIIEWNPDVVHTNCEFSTYHMIFKILKQCKKRPRWIHTFHTDYRYYVGPLTKVKPFTERAIPLFLKSTLNRPDKIIVPSPKTKKYLLESGIVKDENYIAVIPCGISASLDQVDEKLLAELRRDFGFEDKKVIVSLGRLSKEKNIDELLLYFSQFVRHYPDYRLLIAGLGPYLNHLKIKASSLKIGDKVRFYENVPHEQVPTFLRLGDVFASSSVSETQGMTYYEALICGVPVAARDDECLSGIVIPGKNGAFYSDCWSFEKAIINSVDLKKNQSILGFDCSGKAFADRVVDLYQHD